MTIYKIKLLDEQALDLLRTLDKLGVIQVVEKEEVQDEEIVNATVLENRILARMEALEISPPGEEELENIFSEMKAERIAKHEDKLQPAKV